MLFERGSERLVFEFPARMVEDKRVFVLAAPLSGLGIET
ncbi:hypothetical protein D187_000724 [Cystobacter fuscus DSM 2262]|uniref:Uncharacterized protein n=1 Tax=Cystobacter fuscus (strain ATCC 25194 / DSM 2262 / NBRC 100088 / M29) TaxID=1242864 RepID=S9R877_CYSF2|nr:hypothetical protein D187_000724 [Cystobacter fuscus DSM 2262]